jgi:hypothetical protein
MPLQNRVTPWGEIVAISERGGFMGNRGGMLHDPATRTLTRRRWATRTWIICLCDFNGRRRTLMAPNRYTELFFLDEATALAAGHRPCFECRRRDADAFRATWARGRGEPVPRAAAMDAVLHRERLDGREQRRHPLPRAVSALPDGAMVADADAAFVVAGGATFRWSPSGYAPGRPGRNVALLTPPSTLAALDAGYGPRLHASVVPPLTSSSRRPGDTRVS